MPRTVVKFQSGYSIYAGADLYQIAFVIDGDAKILSVLEDTPLSDLALCLKELAEWVAGKIPAPAAPEPPPELELVDP